MLVGGPEPQRPWSDLTKWALIALSTPVLVAVFAGLLLAPMLSDGYSTDACESALLRIWLGWGIAILNVPLLVLIATRLAKRLRPIYPLLVAGWFLSAVVAMALFEQLPD